MKLLHIGTDGKIVTSFVERSDISSCVEVRQGVCELILKNGTTVREVIATSIAIMESV